MANSGNGGNGAFATGGAGSSGVVIIRYTTPATTYIAYLFKSISGFSNFGSYYGNGSTDGPFVWTGFKPRYVMVKRTDTTGDWTILDTARDSFNVAMSTTTANTASVDGSNTTLDFLTGGFKLRTTQAALNAAGGQYIYASFADVPFKYSGSLVSASAASSAGASFLMGMEY